ncbi:MAG: ADP-ribosylation factor-directed GTPase activating protein isoform b [Pirellula sp.]
MNHQRITPLATSPTAFGRDKVHRVLSLAALFLLLGTDIPTAVSGEKESSANQSKVASIRQVVEQTLDQNLKHRLLSSDRNGAWQVIHGAIAYGTALPLEVDGKETPAIDFLLEGGAMQGWDLAIGPVIPATNRPGIIAKVEAGSFIGQGHTDQWLGYFSQLPLALDRDVMVQGKTLKLLDWARQAQFDVPNNTFREYSWTLIALTNFFPDQREWVAADGKTWTLEPLVRFEAQQDLTTSACGGMHRLMGLAHAVRYQQRLGDPVNEGWLMAKNVADRAIDSAKRFQNSDGSFSTQYTSRPGNSADLSLSISATGHTLEFLAYALDANELSKPWMERAVRRLCSMLKASDRIALECGGAYHALSGLKLYHRRRFAESTSK